MNHSEYVAHDATGLAGLVRSGDVTPTELLEAALARLEQVNPTLNAVVRLMEDDARRAIADDRFDGPLRGVPFLAKDLLSNYAGHPTSSGSRLLAEYVMPHDSELVTRVRRTGVTVFGKTNLPEWGLVPFTEPELWGPCRNPWDPSRTPGGSSGGSGAAIAAGIVPMAGGGDGGGSIRIPASCCGLFGLKPTSGRVPTGPDLGEIWRGAVVEHVLSRSVRDSALMLDLTHGPDVGAPHEIAPPAGPYVEEAERDPGRLRIAWTTNPWLGGDVHPDCVAAVEDAVSLLEEMGHEVFEADPGVDKMEFVQAFLTMMSAELGADLLDAEDRLGRKHGASDVEPVTRVLGLLSKGITGRDYAVALRRLEAIGRDMGGFFEGCDVLLTPTLSSPPPPVGSLAPTPAETMQLKVLGALGSGSLIHRVNLIGQLAQEAFDFIPWTPVSNVTGQPAMSVPLYWNADGLPVGVHFVGHFGDEATLFRLAGRLEEARPWFDRMAEL